ncbi:DUF805 domain-containing protein [Caulobacter sp. 17J80-11]|uniref:DUF805 domain-containing protein n=1 Tax=Caulobacter sp. 17J80-11 TaxID=2763502 RepID=UPI001653B669|nr:DUF805 domain-containing protein [Caulobacter sp. 17J80-11]MBC6981363.1 DUF805 domain-containing protein [Caulobacter sp. 17J80-11]
MDKLRSLIVDNFHGRGRLSRKGLGLSLGLFYLFGLVTLPLQLSIALRTGRSVPDLSVAGVLLVLATVVVGWFILGAVMRRLHDRGKGAAWLLVFFGPMAVFSAVGDAIPQGQEPLTTLLIVAGLFLPGPFMIWGGIEILAVRGQPGDNRFGPDPLAAAPVAQEAAA